MVAEGVGTGLLLYVIVGSGIAAEQLGVDPAGQLLSHAVVVGLGLAALIAVFQTVSGSHFNPAVTIAFWRTTSLGGREGFGFIGAQLVGAVAGVALANFTFEIEILDISSNARAGIGLTVAEAVATFVLVLAILMLVRTGRHGAVPAVVGAWVAAIVFATSSTGFANPAVTIGRIFTDSYTGIAPASVAGFLIAQVIAGFAAASVAALLYRDSFEHETTRGD
ncbi:MAG TPA: aquaporin [Acidimicrobiia bacterium]